MLAEIDRLPEQYRAAVVAYPLDGLTQHAAAARLSWPVGTLQSRLDRGRCQLRDRLPQRGLAPAALGLIPPSGLHLTLPTAMISPLARAAVCWAIQANSTGLVSSAVLTLLSTAKGIVAMKLIAALTLTTSLGIVIATGFLPQDGPLDHSPPAPVFERSVGPTATVDPTKLVPVASRTIVQAVPDGTEQDSASPKLVCFVAESQSPIGSGPDWDQLMREKYPMHFIGFLDNASKHDHRVTSCPTYIIVVGAGKELARLEGASTTRQVAQLLTDHAPSLHAEISQPSDKLTPPAQGPGRPTVLCFADEAWEQNYPIDHIFGTLGAKGYAVSYLRIEQVAGLVTQYHILGINSILVAEVGREIARTTKDPATHTLAEFSNENRLKLAATKPDPFVPPTEPEFTMPAMQPSPCETTVRIEIRLSQTN